MSEIVYYKSKDEQITITEKVINTFGLVFYLDDIKSSRAYMKKRERTIPAAIALVGIVTLLLGKHRNGELADIVDISVLFHSSNYFELSGFILLLIALFLGLPDSEQYFIEIKLQNGITKIIPLIDRKYSNDLAQIDVALKQALRFAAYKKR